MNRRSFFGAIVGLVGRGPWLDRWQEYLPLEQRERTLTNGRRELITDDGPVFTFQPIKKEDLKDQTLPLRWFGGEGTDGPSL